MAIYISLVSFTEEGLKKVKDTRKRAKEFTERAKRKGIKIKATYWTLGEYDIVHIFEAQNAEAAAVVSFALGSIGNVRTKTMRAFEAKEIEKILGDVYEMQTNSGTLK